MHYEVWIHGIAVQAEIENNTTPLFVTNDASGDWIVGRPRGFGKSFHVNDGKRLWFHAPIPTPVMMADTWLVLDQVLLDLQLESETSSASLRQIDVWDGSSRLASMPSAPAGSPYPHGLISAAYSPRDQSGSLMRMRRGIVVCMLVDFPRWGTARFNAVGATFRTEENIEVDHRLDVPPRIPEPAPRVRRP